MWMLTHLHKGDKLYLIPEVHKYTVGRAGSNIVLKDDTSISRSHANLLYTDGSLQLEDTGSKYGTYHNENIASKTKVNKGIPIDIKEGDRILFGVLKNEWIVSKINISAMTSALTSPQITEIQGHLNSLGGKLILKWEPSCTHLTMSEITITIKVLHALIEKIPIVSCEFWKNYLENVKEQKPPPNVSMYLPKPSAQLSSAIKPENFDFNDKRKSLFAGKTFVFMSKKHYDMYSQIIKKAGGECKDLKSNTHKSFLLQKNVIIIQYIPTTQSQGSQTVNVITDYLESHSIRTIPEYEIGLAIVCCTTEKYCNPAYKTISHVLPSIPVKTPNIGTILAENTRSQKSEVNTSEFMTVEIADSEFPHNARNNKSNKQVLQSEIYEEKISELDRASDESNRSNSAVSNINNNESNRSYCKRRRTPNIEEENTVKKIHLSQDCGINFTETENDPNSNCKNTLPIKSNAVNSKKPDTINSNHIRSVKDKLIPVKRYSGFLQKSQICAPNKEISENRSEATKRGRIACITDNGSDCDDDIFDFGSPAKKRRTSCNSDDELFAFEKKGAEDLQSAKETFDDVLPQTQPFIDKNHSKTKNMSKIKISPVKPSSEGWLSKLNMIKIKEDNDTLEEIKEDDNDVCKNEWIDSIRGAFEVRIRKMNLASKENILYKVPSTSNAIMNTSKNFKAFVKKNNYKPQTLIIRTSRR